MLSGSSQIKLPGKRVQCSQTRFISNALKFHRHEFDVFDSLMPGDAHVRQ